MFVFTFAKLKSNKMKAEKTEHIPESTFNNLLWLLSKGFETKQEFCFAIQISRVRLHDILTEKHELKQSKFEEYKNKVGAYREVNKQLGKLGFDLQRLVSEIMADINKAMSITSQEVRNAQRWVSINDTRIFFMFDAVRDKDDNLDILRIYNIDGYGDGGELLPDLTKKYIEFFINK